MKIENYNRIVKDGEFFLTIGYATHNRKDCINRRLNYLMSMNIPDNIEIIVVDNASQDGTYASILGLCSGSNIKIYRNEVNLGFSGNFIEVLKKAKGHYVLWSSDEDDISLEGIDSLFHWIKKRNCDVICLNHYRKENSKNLVPLRENRTRLMNIDDIWSASHLPGIMWNREVVLNNLNNWSDLVTEYPQISRFYPNMLLLIKLMPRQKSFFYNGFITYQKDFEKSQHAHQQGDAYFHLSPRWRQHKELICYIESRYQTEKVEKYRRYLSKMKKFLNIDLYEFLSEAIRQEKPEFHFYFSRSTWPSSIIRRNYRLLKIVTKSFINNPLLTVRKINRRIRIRYKN